MTGAFGSISGGVFLEATGLETLHLGGGQNNNWETNNAISYIAGGFTLLIELLPTQVFH